MAASKEKAAGKPTGGGTAKKYGVHGCTTSRFRGVTKHRRSGRWEAHIWVAEKGKQVYLGGYELEEHAASAYDVAGLKTKGARAKTNFDVQNYKVLAEYLDKITFDDLVTAVRRQSQGFSRGSSSFRGVTRHPSGRFEARVGVSNGAKHIYLGIYDTEADAARAYDRAVIMLRGAAATTNFPLADYVPSESPSSASPQAPKQEVGMGALAGLAGQTAAGVNQNGQQVPGAASVAGLGGGQTLQGTLASMMHHTGILSQGTSLAPVGLPSTAAVQDTGRAQQLPQQQWPQQFFPQFLQQPVAQQPSLASLAVSVPPPSHVAAPPLAVSAPPLGVGAPGPHVQDKVLRPAVVKLQPGSAPFAAGGIAGAPHQGAQK